VDGRARLGEQARPLIERIPAGIYRELLADEVAKVVGLDPQRMGIALAPEEHGAEKSASSARRPLPAGERHVASRRNLVRQSVHLLVHYPEIADKIAGFDGLAAVDKPGIPLLMDLIQELRRQPCATTGALLERWRGRPDVEHLAKLAALECLIPDAAGAARELVGAIRQLIEEGAIRRREQLLSKHGREGLTDAEKAELQGLLRARTPPAADLGGRA
jgi:DNA primase